MNITFEFFSDCNVSVQLLQNESSNMIAMVISYIRQKKNDTEQMLIAYTQFETANNYIHYIHFCSFVLFVIKRTKLTFKLS
jgi:hypothetical protein